MENKHKNYLDKYINSKVDKSNYSSFSVGNILSVTFDYLSKAVMGSLNNSDLRFIPEYTADIKRTGTEVLKNATTGVNFMYSMKNDGMEKVIVTSLKDSVSLFLPYESPSFNKTETGISRSIRNSYKNGSKQNLIAYSLVVGGPGGSVPDMPREVEAELKETYDYLDKLEKEFGLPNDLLKALYWHESRWDNNAVSKEGAVGIAQIIPRWHNVERGDFPNGFVPSVGRKNWKYTAKYGATYLRDLINQWGHSPESKALWSAAVFSYNNGNPYSVSDDADFDLTVKKYLEEKPWLKDISK